MQLAATWFVTLAVLVGAFLTASTQVPDHSTWLSAVFAFAAVFAVPFFALLVFRLQTHHRAALMSDEYIYPLAREVEHLTTRRGQPVSPHRPHRIARRVARNAEIVRGARI